MREDSRLKAESKLMLEQEKKLGVANREKNRKKSKSKGVLLRHKVWLKYNKHCAYCGKELEYKDMQVDHLYPRHLIAWLPDERARKIHGFATNDFINLMPSCRRCNHYKRQQTLEGFRGMMITLHERIQGLYIGKVAIDYGIITIKPFDGIFYFERFDKAYPM